MELLRTTLSNDNQSKATAMPATRAGRYPLECTVPRPPVRGESPRPSVVTSVNLSALATGDGRASGAFVLRGLFIMVSMATLVVGGWLTWQTLQRNEFRTLVDELRSPSSRAGALPPIGTDDRPQASPLPAPGAEPVVPAAAEIPIHSDQPPIAEQTMVPLDLESTADTSELPREPLREAARLVPLPVIITPPSTSEPFLVVALVATEAVRIEPTAPPESAIARMPDPDVMIAEVVPSLPSDEPGTRLADEPVVSAAAEPRLSTVDTSELPREPLPSESPPVVALVAIEAERIEQTAPTELVITSMPDPDTIIAEIAPALPSIESATRLPDEPVVNPAAGPPLDGGIFELGTVDVAPRLLERVDPAVRRRHFRRAKPGRVELLVVIDRMGHVASASVHSATDEALVAPSLRAVRLWRFSPARKQGQAVSVRVAVPLVFQSL